MAKSDWDMWRECDICNEVLHEEEFGNYAESPEVDQLSVCDNCMAQSASPDYNAGFED